MADTTQNRSNPPQISFAGFHHRLGACLIDTFVCMVLVLLMIIALAAIGAALIGPDMLVVAQNDWWRGTMKFLGGAVSFFYLGWPETTSMQGSLGKRFFKLRVTNLEGGRITWNQAIRRLYGKTLSCFTVLGMLMPLWTKQKQALHDKLAGCVVLRGL